MTERELFSVISKRMFGRTWADTSLEHVCVRCGRAVEGFRDEEGAVAYDEIGYCQACQDGEGEPGYMTDSIFDICPACHEGDMENGQCNHCWIREVR